MTDKPHTLAWFKNRVGKPVKLAGESTLFNQPLVIASEMHAKAMFIAQKEKKLRYLEV